MTWKAVAALLAAVALATGCALPGSSAPAKLSAAVLLPGEHCADLLAAALTSPNAPVAGAFDCQTPTLQLAAAGSGVTGDAGIAKFAQGLGFTSAVDIGGASGEFLFQISGPSMPTEVLIVWMDADGLVSDFQRVIHP